MSDPFTVAVAIDERGTIAVGLADDNENGDSIPPSGLGGGKYGSNRPRSAFVRPPCPIAGKQRVSDPTAT
ncbi:hypothetical protein ACFQ08_08890 [Streptosporangium algeriense]|uniref:Uncharacterized protein n=1 Tax=Streptosporangium algeriense TaxID=1682748 RepID=A0ABW3DNX1_9ACTN